MSWGTRVGRLGLVGRLDLGQSTRRGDERAAAAGHPAQRPPTTRPALRTRPLVRPAPTHPAAERTCIRLPRSAPTHARSLAHAPRPPARDLRPAHRPRSGRAPRRAATGRTPTAERACIRPPPRSAHPPRASPPRTRQPKRPMPKYPAPERLGDRRPLAVPADSRPLARRPVLAARAFARRPRVPTRARLLADLPPASARRPMFVLAARAFARRPRVPTRARLPADLPPAPARADPCPFSPLARRPAPTRPRSPTPARPSAVSKPPACRPGPAPCARSTACPWRGVCDPRAGLVGRCGPEGVSLRWVFRCRSPSRTLGCSGSRRRGPCRGRARGVCLGRRFGWCAAGSSWPGGEAPRSG